MVHEHNKNGIASEMMICVTKTIHKVGSINLHSQRYYEIVTKDKLILYNTFLPIRLMQHLAASTKLYKKKKKHFCLIVRVVWCTMLVKRKDATYDSTLSYLAIKKFLRYHEK